MTSNKYKTVLKSHFWFEKQGFGSDLCKPFWHPLLFKNYMPIISAVGLFCCDKFEEIPNEKVVNVSKLTKSYFRIC